MGDAKRSVGIPKKQRGTPKICMEGPQNLRLNRKLRANQNLRRNRET